MVTTPAQRSSLRRQASVSEWAALARVLHGPSPSRLGHAQPAQAVPAAEALPAAEAVVEVVAVQVVQLEEPVRPGWGRTSCAGHSDHRSVGSWSFELHRRLYLQLRIQMRLCWRC